MKIQWEGKVLDVGNIGDRRGVVFEVEGQDVEVFGLTLEETKEAGALLYKRVKVEITISAVQPGEAHVDR